MMRKFLLKNFSRALIEVSKRKLQNFVPKHDPVSEHDVRILENFVWKSDSLVVVTGAGISTESGIPDYRSEDVGLYARSTYKPVQYQQFLKSAIVRHRYWARNFVGWETFSKRQPNTTHNIVRTLEIEHGKVSMVITQNVDSLHKKAGSKNVIELHGTAFEVICLNCHNKYSRHDIQEKIRQLNPAMRVTLTMIRPDGDVHLTDEEVKNFTPPFCEACKGILKPDIVFFGDNVPKERVRKVEGAISACDSVLFLGTSLSVFSAYRLVLQAVEEAKKVVIVNIGPTRADKLDVTKISARCGDILPKIVV